MKEGSKFVKACKIVAEEYMDHLYKEGVISSPYPTTSSIIKEFRKQKKYTNFVRFLNAREAKNE